MEEKYSPEVQEIMDHITKDLRSALDEFVDKPLEENVIENIKRATINQLEDIGFTPTYVEVFPNNKKGEYTIKFSVAEHWLFGEEEDEWGFD